MERQISTQAEINTITAEILQRKKDIAINMLEIGDRMIKAKALLDHGQFGEWLEHTVSFSERTARNMMRAAKAFPEAKRQAISDLSSTQVLLLAELPEDSREDFMGRVDFQEVTTRELKAAIKAEKANSDIRSHFAESTEASYQEFNISLDKLKKHPDYDEYVEQVIGHRTGKKYIDFLQNMENGLYFAIMITKDGIIIDGHERVRAAHDLGWTEIKARYMPPIPDAIATGSYELALKAELLYWKAWDFTRTSLFHYYFSEFYFAIGNTEKGARYGEIFKQDGERIDREYADFQNALQILNDTWQNIGYEKEFKEALTAALPKLKSEGVSVPECWKDAVSA